MSASSDSNDFLNTNRLYGKNFYGLASFALIVQSLPHF